MKGELGGRGITSWSNIAKSRACAAPYQNERSFFGYVRISYCVAAWPSSRSGVVFLSVLEANDSYFYEILRRGSEAWVATRSNMFANTRKLGWLIHTIRISTTRVRVISMQMRSCQRQLKRQTLRNYYAAGLAFDIDCGNFARKNAQL